MTTTPTETLRRHPGLLRIWKEAESRHLSPEEFEHYVQVTGYRDRVTAAQEVRAVEAGLVKRIVSEMFAKYPYEEHHQHATAKCIRDVRYVSAYSTMAMLMDDVDWLDEKLLIWLKTILQSFEFPDAPQRRKVLFAAPSTDSRSASLDGKRRSIHDTYTRLRDGYGAALTANSFALMKPALQRVVDTLTED